jgi:hypothetical protein
MLSSFSPALPARIESNNVPASRSFSVPNCFRTELDPSLGTLGVLQLSSKRSSLVVVDSVYLSPNVGSFGRI